MWFAICIGVVVKMKLAVGSASETDVGVAMELAVLLPTGIIAVSKWMMGFESDNKRLM